MTEYKHPTGLNTIANPNTGMSNDEYAQKFGWAFEVILNYEEYRMVNDLAIDTYPDLRHVDALGKFMRDAVMGCVRKYEEKG